MGKIDRLLHHMSPCCYGVIYSHNCGFQTRPKAGEENKKHMLCEPVVKGNHRAFDKAADAATAFVSREPHRQAKHHPRSGSNACLVRRLAGGTTAK